MAEYIKDLTETKICVITPYNPNFVADLKSRIPNPEWDMNKRYWIVQSKYRDIVLELLRAHYGINGESVNNRTITIKSKLDIMESKKSVYFAGFPIVRAWGRDSGAKVCENAVMISGNIRSGGSVKNWLTIVEADSTFRVEIPETAIAESDSEWEVVDSDEKTALIKLKDELLKQIAEIDEKLAKL